MVCQIHPTKTAAMTSQPTSAAKPHPAVMPMMTAPTTPTTLATARWVAAEVNLMSGSLGALGVLLGAIPTIHTR